ncbi:MAG: hypothetical protein H6646_00775 [Anaerolineales bacterium]|nr:hypothetical protein [Anaerolineales bacterium]
MPTLSRTRIIVAAMTTIVVLALAACGGGQEPTPTPTPVPPTAAPTATPVPPTPEPEPTATEAPAEVEPAQAQPESPLDQPESPLGQPESPLAAPDGASGLAALIQLGNDTKAPTPEAGAASIGGVLYGYGDQAIVGTVFYLTPAVQDGDKFLAPTIYVGPKEENGDVSSQTEITGQFSVANIPPGVYYLAVWAPYDWILAFPDQNAQSPLQITVEAGDQLDLGALFVPWP